MLPTRRLDLNLYDLVFLAPNRPSSTESPLWSKTRQRLNAGSFPYVLPNTASQITAFSPLFLKHCSTNTRAHTGAQGRTFANH